MKWTTLSTYVDIETGEIISPWEYKENYYTIKTEKDAKISREAFKGTISRTYYGRRSPKQRNLFEPETNI